MKNNLITASALLLGCQSISYAKEQPNIVILFVDDLGWADLGYNNPVFDTPNINKLKSDGLYFSRAYVASATSSPSRASLMTGKESLRCGFVRHIYGKDTSLEFETFENDPGKMKSRAYLPLEEITYAERLKDFGYYNMFVGKWHLGTESYFPTKQGFDAMYSTCEHGHPNSYYQPFFKTNNPFPKAGKNDYLINMVGNGAVDFINKYDKKAPFLLNVWYYGVHGPQIGRKDLVVKYEKHLSPVPPPRHTTNIATSLPLNTLSMAGKDLLHSYSARKRSLPLPSPSCPIRYLPHKDNSSISFRFMPNAYSCTSGRQHFRIC